MKKRTVLMVALAAVLAVAMIGGCTAMTGGGERPEAEGGSGEGGNEHGARGERGGSENGSEGGEEGGRMLALDETFDEVRKGARLILSYNAGANEFSGTVENTTSATLEQVRVEVHLSNGVELGPTTPQDLPADETAWT